MTAEATTQRRTASQRRQVLAATSQYDVDGQSESVEQRTMQTPASEQNARSPCCEHSALVVQSVVQSGSDSASAQT